MAPELWAASRQALFAPLGRPDLSNFAALLLDSSAAALLTTRNIALKFDDAVLAHLVDQGASTPRRARAPGASSCNAS